ncbi:MAG: ATP-dependent DNA helicase RecG, partial [Clostridiales bacterium]|nr:ATP-dependent DNA helicase RecG [Clostridiales bacterium]
MQILGRSHGRRLSLARFPWTNIQPQAPRYSYACYNLPLVIKLLHNTEKGVPAVPIQPKDALRALPGVGAARAAALGGLGLRCAGDLLRWFPRGYEDRTRLCAIRRAPAGEPVCISAMVAEAPRLSRVRSGLDVVRVKVVDSAAALTLVFFNQRYVTQSLRPGVEYIFFGKVEGRGLGRVMTNPYFERADARRFTGRIVPVYRLTAGISNRLLADLIRRVLEDCLPAESMPLRLREWHGLLPLADALRAIHFPDSWAALVAARRRLVFEEFFVLSLGMAFLRKRRTDRGPRLTDTGYASFAAALPFPLTGAQTRVLDEVAADLASGRPMNRLVQGDVGSGKTVVAAAAAVMAVKNGFQCAMMVPTELLAQQHHKSLSALLRGTGIRPALLTGSAKAAEKRRLYAALERGEVDFVIGTHALLSAPVAFRRLGLVVVDEQHRFGVDQRAGLTAKATGDVRPHLLVLSATPIPRTLALIVYGDLDVSVIDELPPGRRPVETFVIGESTRARLYRFVRRLVAEGRQVYIVCPAVEEAGAEEDMPEGGFANLKAVMQYAGELRDTVFPDLRVAFLHGRMKAGEKEAVMTAFGAGGVDILVSTTVIEVGVDVPNATLMVVENADRFGLSQLHQLRGRVGRGSDQSYCVLVTASQSPDAKARLKTLTATNDGFLIAEEDLRLRGPG